MITGSVINLEARIKVTFRLQGRPDVEIEFVIDTGFAGALTLPRSAVASLGLPYLQEMIANLADDNGVKTDVHIGTIIWHGKVLQTAVLAMGSRPLLGTALIAGNTLSAQFIDNGLVAIDDTP